MQGSSLKGPARWLLENEEVFSEFIDHIRTEYNEDAEWDDIIEGCQEWFEENGIDHVREEFPVVRGSLREVYDNITRGTFLVWYYPVEEVPDDEQKEKANDEQTEKSKRKQATLPLHNNENTPTDVPAVASLPGNDAGGKNEAFMARLQEAKKRELKEEKEKKRKALKEKEEKEKKEIDRVVAKYPDDPYKYKGWDRNKQLQFEKQQYFTQLTDDQQETRRRYDDDFPIPPNFYDPSTDHTIKEEIIGDKFDLEACIPEQEFIWAHEEFMKFRNGEVARDKGVAKEEIASWKEDFRKWLYGKLKLEKELDKKFKKELHDQYKREKHMNVAELKEFKKLLDKHNEDDTRQSTEVYKFLKKTFPTNDYENYTREEALRLKAHKAQMTPQERLEMEQNKRFVEQLGQLQYFPPKTEKNTTKTVCSCTSWRSPVTTGEGYTSTTNGSTKKNTSTRFGLAKTLMPNFWLLSMPTKENGLISRLEMLLMIKRPNFSGAKFAMSTASILTTLA